MHRLAIQGAELHPANPFGGKGHHFVVLNIRDEIDANKMAPQHVIDEARTQGASPWLAHPYWSSVNILRDTLPLTGLSGLEVYNTTCQTNAGRGESSVHWDDWMDLTKRIYPAIATDDAHFPGSDGRDTYGGWTMVRAKERSAEAIVAALEQGASYSSAGPEIHDIQIQQFEATIKCSEASRIVAVCDSWGTECRGDGSTFNEAIFALRPNARHVRFEIIDPAGAKAWSNPFDLTALPVH